MYEMFHETVLSCNKSNAYEVVIVVCICPDQLGCSLLKEETMLVRRIIFFAVIFVVTIFVG